ncbi:hypothetical protein GBA52_023147 [Prunus armeniaca]|nr:hypothetical protein GBA52_023147 [Prunus armeniaca]
MYNASTYAVNYCIIGLNWIGFDDVEAIRAKIAYVKCISQEEEATWDDYSAEPKAYEHLKAESSSPCVN